MKRLLIACALGVVALGAGSANGQIRRTAVDIDNGSSNFLHLVAPAGLTAPSQTLRLPVPPVSNPLMGFLNVGTVQGQLPWWDPTGSGEWKQTTNLIWDNAGNSLTIGAPSSVAGSLVMHDGAGTNFTATIKTQTTLTGNRTFTFPDVDGTIATTGNSIGFDVTSTQTSTTPANRIFDVASNVTGASLGARVAATGTTNASGLTVTATAGAASTATGFSVAASGGTTNHAIDVTNGDVRIQNLTLTGNGGSGFDALYTAPGGHYFVLDRDASGGVGDDFRVYNQSTGGALLMEVSHSDAINLNASTTSIGDANTDLVNFNAKSNTALDMNAHAVSGVTTLTTNALAGHGTNKYAETFQVIGDGASTDFAIANSNVSATSTIIVTPELSDEAVPAYYDAFIASRGAGTFTVHLSGVIANTKHVNLHYIIVN